MPDERPAGKLKNRRRLMLVFGSIIVAALLFSLVWRFVVGTPEKADMGISVIPQLPDKFEFPFVVEVRTSDYVLTDIKATCLFREVIDEHGVAATQTDAGLAQPWARLEPGEVYRNLTCLFPDPERRQEIKSAVIAIDLAYTLANGPERYFVRRVFRISQERGTPVWIQTDETFTGPFEKRPRP